MRIVILKPVRPVMGSGIRKEHLPPLGLLMIKGVLVDAGREVNGAMTAVERARDVAVSLRAE